MPANNRGLYLLAWQVVEHLSRRKQSSTIFLCLVMKTQNRANYYHLESLVLKKHLFLHKIIVV